MVYSVLGWLTGEHPPGKQDLSVCVKVVYHLLLAHVRAYKIIKRFDTNARVGIATNMVLFRASRGWVLFDILLARILNNTYNWAFPTAAMTGKLTLGVNLPFMNFKREIALAENTLDYFGLNHYCTCCLSAHLMLMIDSSFQS